MECTPSARNTEFLTAPLIKDPFVKDPFVFNYFLIVQDNKTPTVGLVGRTYPGIPMAGVGRFKGFRSAKPLPVPGGELAIAHCSYAVRSSV